MYTYFKGFYNRNWIHTRPIYSSTLLTVSDGWFKHPVSLNPSFQWASLLWLVRLPYLSLVIGLLLLQHASEIKCPLSYLNFISSNICPFNMFQHKLTNPPRSGVQLHYLKRVKEDTVHGQPIKTTRCNKIKTLTQEALNQHIVGNWLPGTMVKYTLK